MKAMIFAAGLGTRLRPLTNDRPKALVEIGGRTLLEITLERLREFGVREVVINVHHFADKVAEYLEARDYFGMRIAISREDDLLLDTGGGLKKAAPLFLDDAQAVKADDPIVVHNVDVLSTIDLAKIAETHRKRKALATLAVQERRTSRYLLFDEEMILCGRRIGQVATAEVVRQSRMAQPLAFAGIHVISPRLFSKLTEDGAFSIVASYLRLAGAGERITGFRADGAYWRDLGRPEDLVWAAEDLRARRVET
ncbi:MAG TPA: nucleotidyltransferase family protein [Terriglobales bacterium]|nr:nucleotidyltransferase family protein [Terriglobales bacterium]